MQTRDVTIANQWAILVLSFQHWCSHFETRVHVGVSLSFVVFLCAMKHVFHNLPYCQYDYLYLFYLIRTTQFSALHIILSFPQYLNCLKHHCVSCTGAGARISWCSVQGRSPQNERPAGSGLSCGCSEQSEYSSSVFSSLYVNYQAYVYTHVYRPQCGPCSEGLHVVDKSILYLLVVGACAYISDNIAKWLIERTGNITGPWASFRAVRTKSMIKCNSKLNKSLLRLLWTVFVPSVFTVTVYTSFGPPSSRWQTSQLFSSVYKTLWGSDVPVRTFQR